MRDVSETAKNNLLIIFDFCILGFSVSDFWVYLNFRFEIFINFRIHDIMNIDLRHLYPKINIREVFRNFKYRIDNLAFFVSYLLRFIFTSINNFKKILWINIDACIG